MNEYRVALLYKTEVKLSEEQVAQDIEACLENSPIDSEVLVQNVVQTRDND
jgi:hypothetical protein